MNKIKTLAGALLLGGATLAGNAQNISNKDLYTTIEQGNLKGKETNINKLLSVPEWTQYKPTDYGLGDDYGASVYFDTNDKTIIFGGTGGMTVDSNNAVHSYGPASSGNTPSNFPSFAAGMCSWKDGDTLYRGVSDPVGALFVQVGNDSWIEQFTTSEIKSIKKDSQGNLRIATAGDGVYVRNGGTTIQHYTTSNSGLSSDRIFNVVVDGTKKWFTTWGGGLAKFDGTNRTIYNGTNTGLGNNFNYGNSTKIDQNGVLWMGGVKFYRFDTTTGQGVLIPKPAWMIHNIESIDVDQFGNVHAGSQDGYAFYNPTLDTRTQINGGIPEFSGWVNGLDVMSDASDPDTLKVCIADGNGGGLTTFKQSTADYLPQFPTNCHIDGEDSVLYEHSYTYTLSAPAVNASEYEWSYTGSGVTITPNGVSVDLYFGPTATVGNLVCKIKNNFTSTNNDTIQKIFTIKYVGDDVGVDEQIVENPPVVYPNPVADQLHIANITRKDNIVGAEILNIYGKMLKDNIRLIPGEDINIDVSGFSAGSYVIVLQDGDGDDVWSTKFVKL